MAGWPHLNVLNKDGTRGALGRLKQRWPAVVKHENWLLKLCSRDAATQSTDGLKMGSQQKEMEQTKTNSWN